MKRTVKRALAVRLMSETDPELRGVVEQHYWAELRRSITEFDSRMC